MSSVVNERQPTTAYSPVYTQLALAGINCPCQQNGNACMWLNSTLEQRRSSQSAAPGDQPLQMASPDTPTLLTVHSDALRQEQDMTSNPDCPDSSWAAPGDQSLQVASSDTLTSSVHSGALQQEQDMTSFPDCPDSSWAAPGDQSLQVASSDTLASSVHSGALQQEQDMTSIPEGYDTPSVSSKESQEPQSSTPPHLSRAHVSKPGTSNDIGPFANAAGIKRYHFLGEPVELPRVDQLKNGLVLELYNYSSRELRISDRAFARKLMVLSGVTASEVNVVKFVSNLKAHYSKIKRNVKGEARANQLSSLQDTEFTLLRSRNLKTPDTPRKQKLRAELFESKTQTRGLKRKLAKSEACKDELREKLHEQKVQSEDEIHQLSSSIEDLESKFNAATTNIRDLTASFDPTVHELDTYKKKYTQKVRELTSLEEKLSKCKDKLQKADTRNVNKKLKRRDVKVQKLKNESEDLKREVRELHEELELSREQMKAAKDSAEHLRKDGEVTSRRLYKKAWYQMKQRKRQVQSNHEDGDMNALQDRVSFLERRSKELEELIALLEDEEIITFQEGRFNDSIRRTIMELLAQNVSMNKVNSVIRTVLKNLAGKTASRLPSAGTRSRLSLEANHLATIEVALAMKSANPSDAVGNCIHGDGTTKHHRKYQNFEVTLPDGTSRSIAMMEMGAGDTAAVMDAFTDRIKDLAATLQQITGEDKEDVYRELISTIKSTMTDQGPTMPQFNERLNSIRKDLLPQVVENWKSLPCDVQECIQQFGQFYCKMHPLVNFAEEVNKILKNFEDFTTSGRHAHIFQTSEAGATRLVRTTSKALHSRGCDKSGVEDVFTSFLQNAYGVQNKLVNYIGSRANIVFEGSAALYFHVEHVQEFLSMLGHKNQLLLAVEEDVNEKIYIAELRALGLFYRVAIKPLWDIIRGAENILDTNKSLHKLQVQLLKWKDDASSILTGDSPYNVDLTDAVGQKLLQSCDAESEVMTTQALELISCAVLLILQRQCKDQLPGGKYWDPPKQIVEAFGNVPSTNLIGERDFAQLDLLIRKRPSSRITTLESVIMWTNNGTPEWLDRLSDEERQSYMKMARQGSDKVLEKYKERRKKIKAAKWEALQKSQQKKEETEQKKIQTTASLVNEIMKLGGLWTSHNKIDERIEELMRSESEEKIRRALFAQLSFLQKVVNCKGPTREHYQLTHQQHSYSSQEMTEHLKEVVSHNKLSPEIDVLEMAESQAKQTTQTPTSLEYAVPEEQSVDFEEQKRMMQKKIQEEEKKRAAQTSKLQVDLFLQTPELLIGKEVQHLFIVDSERKWVKGRVTGISTKKADACKTVYAIDYEDENEIKHYNLLSDLKKNELIVCD